nr:hypothetical protein [Pseudomonadota bacterium]
KDLPSVQIQTLDANIDPLKGDGFAKEIPEGLVFVAPLSSQTASAPILSSQFNSFGSSVVDLGNIPESEPRPRPPAPEVDPNAVNTVTGGSRVVRRGGRDSTDPDGYFSVRIEIPEELKLQRTIEGGLTVANYSEYVGILPTTDLGAPLTQAPASVIWHGQFNGISYVNFYVDFAKGQFGFHNDKTGAESGIGELSHFFGGFLVSSAELMYKMDGIFGNHPDAKGFAPGQLGGSVSLSASEGEFLPVFYGDGKEVASLEADLIGLIGIEGAVGVFTKAGKNNGFSGGFTATNEAPPPPPPPSDPTAICAAGLLPFDGACTDAKFNANRIEHCNSTGLSTYSGVLEECTELVKANPCLENPFDTGCEATAIFQDSIDTLRLQRIQLCRFGGGIDTACDFVNSCGDNGNPFSTACLEFDAFDQNRATRVKLCLDANSRGQAIFGCSGLVNTETTTTACNSNGCAGGFVSVGSDQTTIAQCITNPFLADCTDDVFDVVRVTACSVPATAAGLACTTPISADNGAPTFASCISNPFAPDCQVSLFDTVRVNRLIACGGASDPSDVSCTVARTGATTANWLRSFDGSSNNPPLDTEPDTDTSRNQFLQGTQVVPVLLDQFGSTAPNGIEGGLDTGETQVRVDPESENSSPPVVYFLNLATAQYGERENRTLLMQDGDARDGVAFFLGDIAGATYAYAGILAGTNLGAVPVSTTPSATWNGQFSAIGHYFINKDFELDIDFSNRSVAAFVQVSDDATSHFLLNGNFDATTGVIDGTVELGDFAGNDRTATLPNNEHRGSGMLTGLIGEDGAVGVFIKNNDDTGQSSNFAGGFVAVKP